MEAVGGAAACIELIKVAKETVDYIVDVKHAPTERARFIAELSGLITLLCNLRDVADDLTDQGGGKQVRDSPFTLACNALASPSGPFESLRQQLVDLGTNLQRGSKLGRIRNLVWTLDKAEALKILDAIERVKSSISLLLEGSIASSLMSIHGKNTVIEAGVQELKAQAKVQNDRKRKLGIEEWLTNIDFRAHHHEIASQRAEGTGQWLIDHDAFVDWRNGTSGTLWCQGIPGAGKTVLASLVIDHLRQSVPRGSAVLYAYLRYNEQGDQTPKAVFSSLLRQLSQNSEDLPDGLQVLHDKHDNTTTFSADDVVRTLAQDVIRFGSVIIVIDALDEFVKISSFAEGLLALSASCKVLVTSRFSLVIENTLHPGRTIEISAQNDDLRRYIKHRIRAERLLSSNVKRDTSLEPLIVNCLQEKAKGMFLLVKLHLDTLATKTKPRAVKEALPSLPVAVHESYDEVIKRILAQPPEWVSLAKRALNWVVNAQRPLRLAELRVAVAIEPSMTCIEDDDLDDEHALISVCLGLLVVNQNTRLPRLNGRSVAEAGMPASFWEYCRECEHGTIRLAHETAQAYFETRSYQGINLLSTCTPLVETCLTYLSFDIFQNRSYDYYGRRLKHALFDYAEGYWGHHAGVDDMQKKYEDHIITYATSSKMNLAADHRACPSGLDIDEVVYHGLSHIMGRLLELGMFDVSTCPKAVAYINMAVARGHHKLALLLLDKDPPQVHPDMLRDSFLYTIRTYNISVVQALLRWGLVPTLGDLMVAATCPSDEMLRIVVEAADPTTRLVVARYMKGAPTLGRVLDVCAGTDNPWVVRQWDELTAVQRLRLQSALDPEGPSSMTSATHASERIS